MSFGLITLTSSFFIYISRNSKWVLDPHHNPNKGPIYISRNSKWVLDPPPTSGSGYIYISRNSKWVLDKRNDLWRVAIYISRNSKWVLDAGTLQSAWISTSVEIRNEFWTLSKGFMQYAIYTSRNSKWVLDHLLLGQCPVIYISRNSKWVLDVTEAWDWLLTSTSVEIRNEFWTRKRRLTRYYLHQ